MCFWCIDVTSEILCEVHCAMALLECNTRGSAQGKRVHMRAKRALGGKDMVLGFSKVAGGLPRVPTSCMLWFSSDLTS